METRINLKEIKGQRQTGSKDDRLVIAVSGKDNLAEVNKWFTRQTGEDGKTLSTEKVLSKVFLAIVKKDNEEAEPQKKGR